MLAFSGVRFAMLSGSSFLMNFGLTALLSEVARLRSEVSFLIALIVVFFVNFLAMRYWVYGGGCPRARFFPQMATFLGSSLGFRASEYAAFLVLHTALGLHYALAVPSILILASLAKFLFYRAAVFAVRPGSDPGPESDSGGSGSENDGIAAAMRTKPGREDPAQARPTVAPRLNASFTRG